MKKKQSSFSVVIVAIAVLLTVLVIIAVFSTPVFGHYFPNPNAFDLRFNPDAIRNGTLYGRAWISNEVNGGMLKTLPPKNPGTMPFPQPALPATE